MPLLYFKKNSLNEKKNKIKSVGKFKLHLIELTNFKSSD